MPTVPGAPAPASLTSYSTSCASLSTRVRTGGPAILTSILGVAGQARYNDPAMAKDGVPVTKNGRFYNTLRFKVTIGLLIPLWIALSAFSYVQHTNQRRLLLQNLERSAANAGEIVESGLLQAMMRNDFTDVQAIVNDIAAQPAVLDLFLLDKRGHVVLSAGEKRAGISMSLSDATCQACHRYEAASRNESVILTTLQDLRVFRNVNSIENREACQSCHDPQQVTSGVLITDFSMAEIDVQLNALTRSSLIWEGASALVILLIVNFMMSRMVVTRLERFVRAMARVGRGDLSEPVLVGGADEIAQLADSFNRMADGLKEKQRLELRLQERSEELRAQAEKLSALNALAATISQPLNLEDILYSALDKVLELTKLRAGWMMLRDGQDDELRLAAWRGLSEDEARTGVVKAWERCVCQAFTGQVRFESAEGLLSCPCDASQQQDRQSNVQACVPLKSKDRVLGVLGLMGDPSTDAKGLASDMAEMLLGIGQQVGVAIENATLYEELTQKEALRRQLLERVMAIQEDERRRIARELHDETSQALTSLIVRLQVLEQAEAASEIRSKLQDLRAETARTLEKVHHLALELRPSVLDDLGLVAALRRYCRDYEGKFRLPVDFQVVGLASRRLVPEVETALYRIVQEALINVARHAEAEHVSVLLEQRGPSVVAIVEDDGKGFDVQQVMGSSVQSRNLGLYGMQERASLLGGTLTIESSPGTGTAVFVEIPLECEIGGGVHA